MYDSPKNKEIDILTEENKQEISAAMIVKNEEKNLSRCLTSIKDHVDEIIIVDTGSTDNTMEIALSFGAKIYEHPWENHFSKHRNQSIGYATKDWILYIDADEELLFNDRTELRTLLDSCSDVDAALLTVECEIPGGGRSKHNSIRLWKNHQGIHFKGRVHNEVTGVCSGRHIPARLFHYGYNIDQESRKKKFERTTTLLKKEIKANPKHPRPHHYLGISYMEQNKYKEAIAAAETAISLASAQEDKSDLYSGSYHVISSASIETRDLDRAEHWALEALKKYQNHLDSYYNLSRIYYEQKNINQLREYSTRYLELLTRINKTPEEFGTCIFFTTGLKWLVRLYRACAFMDRGITHESDEELNNAMTGCPDKRQFHHLLAGYYMQRKKWQASEDEFKKALLESPDCPDIISDLARLYKQQDRLEDERTQIKMLLRTKPDDIKIQFALGVNYLRQNRIDEAEAWLKKVLKADKDHLGSRINLAVCLRKKGHFEESKAISMKILEEHPDSLEALSNLSHIYYTTQDYEKAQEYFTRISINYPDQLDTYVFLSQIFLITGDIESCVTACDNLLRLLDLKRDIVLNSLKDLGEKFLEISEKLLSADKPYLSRISSETGQILTSDEVNA